MCQHPVNMEKNKMNINILTRSSSKFYLVRQSLILILPPCVSRYCTPLSPRLGGSPPPASAQRIWRSSNSCATPRWLVRWIFLKVTDTLLAIWNDRLIAVLRIRVRMDPRYFGKLDLDPHWSQPSGLLEAQNKVVEAMDASNGGVEAQNGTVEGL